MQGETTTSLLTSFFFLDSTLACWTRYGRKTKASTISMVAILSLSCFYSEESLRSNAVFIRSGVYSTSMSVFI